MARTFEQHYNRMVQFKEQLSTLQGLTPDPDSFDQLNNDLQSTSPVSNWRMYLSAAAYSSYSNEVLFDEILDEIENRLEDQGIGQPNWYARKALEFRYGHSLQFIDEKYQYNQTALNDAQALIVKRASAVVEAGKVRIKAAKLNNNDEPIALSTPEVDGLSDYIQTLHPVGIPFAVISTSGDELRVWFDAYFDPQVLNSSGELLTDTSIKPLEQAVNDYIRNLDFGGVFNINELIDRCQQARGIVDPRLQKAEARQTGGSFTTLFDVTGSGPVAPKNYVPQAGYLRIDQLNVTYISA